MANFNKKIPGSNTLSRFNLLAMSICLLLLLSGTKNAATNNNNFRPLCTQVITATSGPDGTISPLGAVTFNCGENATYTITPSPCFHVKNVSVDGISVGAVTTYTFTNVTADHSIDVSFEQDAQLATPVVDGPVNGCPYVGSGTPVTYSVSPDPGASSYDWIVPPSLTLLGGQGTGSIRVLINSGFRNAANKKIKVTAISGCGNSQQAIYTLTATPVATPSTISGNNDVCPIIGTTSTYRYSIARVTDATSYTWTTQAGTTTVSHPNGPGVDDTVIDVSFAANFTNSNISVQAVNGCGSSTKRSITVRKGTPPIPGLINGPLDACAYMAPNGTVATYSVVAEPNLTYNWNIPAGSIGLTGQGTNTISFMFSAGFTRGTVSVRAKNRCGLLSRARSLGIERHKPATPGIIDVIPSDCPDRQYIYAVSALPAYATSITWTTPAGSNIISGQGTRSITVSYPNSSVDGTVTAQAFNNCGSSAIRTSDVRLAFCAAGKLMAAGMHASPATSDEVEVRVFPNPGRGQFRLYLKGFSPGDVNVRILDLQGRILRQFKTAPDNDILFGEELARGNYLVELRQGNLRKTARFIKL